MITLSSAFLCLALNIYHEARGESIIGQHAVAQVTMNRADRDPKKVCSVVTASKQFSWTNDSFKLVKKTKGGYALTEKGEPKDAWAWEVSRRIASATLARANEPDYFVRGATFYHCTWVRPVWRHQFKLVTIIGNHKFYRYPSKSSVT